MITYALFSQIRFLHEQGLSARQIARELKLGRLTVRRWLQRDQFQPRARSPRPSKLDPWRGELLRLLHLHPYSAQQLFQQLQARGYTGSYSILKRFVRQVRPKAQPAFLTLQFAPGECAQVDWGFAGLMPVGATRRRVSFFVMVLCYSRRMYVEFTLSEKLEHWLACHQSAFTYFQGVNRKQPTRRRFVNWLNQCDPTAQAGPGKQPRLGPTLAEVQETATQKGFETMLSAVIAWHTEWTRRGWKRKDGRTVDWPIELSQWLARRRAQQEDK